MNKKKFNILYCLQIVFIILSAFIVGYLLNYSQTGLLQTTNSILFKTNVVPYLITTLILTLLYLGAYGLFNRFFYATAVFYVFFAIYIVANKLKVIYRSEPVLPSDLSFLSNAKEMLTMISGKIVLIVVIVILLVVISCIILEKMYSKKLWRFNIVTRIILIALAVSSIGAFYNVNKEGSTINKLMTKAGYSNFTPNISMTATTNGPLLTFLGNMHVDIMDQPSGYNKTKMANLVTKYRNVADNINEKRPNNNLSDQTLIFVLSESFADPSRVPNIKINQEVAPKIMNIKKENTSGLMLSSGYGGGTANMEYMTFTGLAYNQFSKSLQSPYTQLVTKQDHPVNIVNSFQKSAAIHPFHGNFYDRQTVYPKLGFQSFRNIDSTGKLALKYTDTIGNNPYVSDESSYKNTLWQINQNKGGQFISLVTMQNHMPYNVMYDNNQFNVTNGKAAEIPQQVSNYAKSINFTDNSTQDFLDKLDTIQKPITVVWYGDHLPGLYAKNSMQKYNVVQHETDYFIYSNKYAIEHGYGTRKLTDSTEVTDPNGFIPLALKQMQQQVTPYYALLTKVQEEIPAMAKNSVGKNENLYVDSNGKQISTKNLTSSQRKLLHDYKLVQYDLTVGKGYSKSTINK
ncbi:LTA synthase family protein [Companilactobacillus huachuanensis]|uniref:LTA synthase family protein n=1 Tax=Companilactobacillus huachuanensis TaxID=2559914 RepID=A0ABW1RQ63_9LACO|nr:LTA synthase family protein [Companilactobacillus huachuanensis]